MSRKPQGDSRPLVLIVGATCSGKTALGAALAARFREEGTAFEIVGADARQIYRGVGVGAASPDASGRGGAPHHMVGVADPGEAYSAARYAEEALARVEDIYRRGALPLVVGGSGLYIRALAEGLFDGPEARPEIRERLEAEASERGREAVHARLAAVDPETAARLHPNDLRRVVRALEVHEATGRPASRLRAEQGAPRFASPLYVGLDYPPAVLAGRIERRTRRMLREGMLEEVETLAERNLTSARVFEGLGFQTALALRRGRIAEEEAVREISRLHRNYAKRQRAWFRKIEGARWHRPDEMGHEALLDRAHGEASRYLASRLPVEDAS